MTSVCLYGESHGWGSFAVVGRGMQLALESAGVLAGFVSTTELSLEDDIAPTRGLEAPVAILTGRPDRLGDMFYAPHKKRSVLLAVNSTWIPFGIMRSICAVDEVVSPSEWGAHVIAENLANVGAKTRVVVSKHGILPGFAPSSVEPPLNEWTLLHMASSSLSRKGTRELVEGFLSWPGVKQARLLLCLNRGELEQVRAEYRHRDNAEQITCMPRVNGSPESMSKLYGLADLVVAPSRGEGFGLVPLEALACGVPIAATVCTGHGAWFSEVPTGSKVAIQTGPMEPLEGEGPAIAPSILEDGIHSFLDEAFERRQEMKASALAGAEQVREEWTWQRRTREWICGLS